MNFPPLRVLDLLRERENGTAPDALVARAFDRIAERDPALRSFVALAARDDALSASDPAGPLAGIPIGVKDIFDTGDLPTEYGSPLYEGHRPRFDAALVAMARRAGAAVVGKTATTEFAFLTPAATVNPFDAARTPGGSSAGSAAAVAAGLVAGAFGSQTAGSINRPAAYCGVAGYKPSFRLLPTAGLKTFAWTLDTAGLFAASVEDVGLLASGITGRELTVDRSNELGGLRVGLYRAAFDDQLEPAMVHALSRAAALLEAAGARLVEIAEPEIMTRARAAQERIQIYEGAISLLAERRSPNGASASLAKALDEGARIEPGAYDDERRHARRARSGAPALFEACDVLLVPSALGIAPPIAATGDPVASRLWTLLGVPCLNVPGLGCEETGLPLGVGIVAPFGRDRFAITAAAHLETLIRNA